MKKKLIIFTVLALCLTLVLPACNSTNDNPGENPASNNPTQNGNSNTPTTTNDGNKNGGEKFEYGQDYINEKLGDYHLAYTVNTYSNGESVNSDLEVIRTAEGYYYGTAEGGQVFIKNGDKYDVYMGTGDTYQSMGTQYEKDMVEGMMSGITMYMTAYGAGGSGFIKDGSETVAGRGCVKYTNSASVYGYKYIYTYCIDKETGVCLKLKMDLDGAGTKQGFEFEANTFETSNVSLPDYK